MLTNEEKLVKLMRDHPRLSTRKYAELAVKGGLVDDLDPDELVLREVQKDIRRIARDSKSEPQFAFVSLSMDRGDGTAEEVYVPAPSCSRAEAQRVLDNYASRIEGTLKRASVLCEYWNAKPFQYRLKFNWG